MDEGFEKYCLEKREVKISVMNRAIPFCLSILCCLLMLSSVQAKEGFSLGSEKQDAKRKLLAEEMFLGLYESFIKTLSSKTYFKFKERILNYQNQLASFGTKVFEDGGKSLEKVDALREELHISLKELLGESGFRRYFAYEETIGIRNRLLQMKKQTGFFIPNEKMKEDLVKAMVEVDRTLDVPSTPREQMAFLKKGLDKATKDKIIDLNWKATKAYIKSSTAILSEQLLSDFRNNLEGAAGMLEMGLNNSYDKRVLKRDDSTPPVVKE
jgi:hypothetical protein